MLNINIEENCLYIHIHIYVLTFRSNIPHLLNILLLILLLHATGLMFQLLFLMHRKINLKRPHFAHPNSA